MLLGEVIDELLDDNGLANACAAEQAGLTALDEGLDKVDGLDAGLEDLGLRDEAVVFGSGAMDGHVAGNLRHGLLVHRLANNVPNAAQGLRANGHHDGMTRVNDLGATHQAIGRAHRDGTHEVAGKHGLNFQNDVNFADGGYGINRQRIVNRRQLDPQGTRRQQQGRRYAQCVP